MANYNTRHGEARIGKKTAEYIAWQSLRRRCLSLTSKDYPDYGGRGITLSDEWRESYEAFIRDVGRRPSPSHSIDRIDNDRSYEVGNVRWSTPAEQQHNKRTNRNFTFNGETRCLAEWARLVGLSGHALANRLDLGWSIEQALTAPPRQYKRNTTSNGGTPCLLTLNGETYQVAEWARRIGIHENTLRKRLENGWSVERVLTTPLRTWPGIRHR